MGITSETLNEHHLNAPPQILPASEIRPETYQFPTPRLRRQQVQAGKTPLILVACGSFSPPTLLHLRMFVMVADFVRTNTQFELMGAYFSPVADTYKKVGLAPAIHRIHMCQLAVQSSKWMDVDPWEATQPNYVRTAQVLDHFDHEINEVLGGVKDVEGRQTRVQITLVAGTDLIQTMSQPGVWSPHGLEHIFSNFGVFVVERAGTDTHRALTVLKPWEHKIYYVPQLVYDENSSTKIRFMLRQRMRVDYLAPQNVIEYIEYNGLYQEGNTALASDKANGST